MLELLAFKGFLMDKLSESIKSARKKAGYTQVEFSNLLNIGRSSLAQYEAGIYKPTVETLFQMAQTLGISLSELMGDDIKEKSAKPVPIVGTASCGGCDINHLQEENKKAYYNGDFWKSTLYCVIANGG